MNYITSSQVFTQIRQRAQDTHKGCYGSVLCVCGSSEYRGAAALCTLGALRGGAGLVALAAEENVIQSIASMILEAVFLPLPCANLFTRAERSSCTVVGCGLLPNAQTAQLVAQLLPISQQAVLDAGALIAIASNTDILKTAKASPILTPHPAEMAQLCGKSIDEVQSNREQTASAFAKAYNCIVVLKGRGTIIADAGGGIWQNSTGNAGLARGGSGDILAGLIGALCSNGLAPVEAAKCAAYLHGHAADLCAARLSMQGMLPHDILQDLCTIFKDNGR